MCPMDYSLCRDTVTVYGKDRRLVVENCSYAYEDSCTLEVCGGRMDRRFLLIMPGSEERVFPGDRIYDGVGPEEIDWKTFIPVNVPGLSEVAYARPVRWAGSICHMEAGRK